MFLKRFRFGLLLTASIMFIIYANLFSSQYVSVKPLMTPPSEAIKYFTFGYTETVGDSFWLAAIQNFQECDQSRGGSDLDRNGNRMGLNRTPACSLSWTYHTLSLVLDLIPRFYYAARVGPVVLSVAIDDIEGATRLFQKVLKLYPQDWVIASRAGYHYVFELEDYQKGAALYFLASKSGGPKWMALYASKLSDKDGRKEYAKNILVEMLNSNDLKPEERELFEKKLKALRDIR